MFSVIVLKSDDLFSHRHHSHPLRLPRDRFSSVLCKLNRKNLDFHLGVTPQNGVTRLLSIRYGSCVGGTVLSPCYTRAISERFRNKELIYKALYKFAFFTFTFSAPPPSGATVLYVTLVRS